jgi:hypothetical protein
VFQSAFQDFLRDELKVRDYALLATPGGAQCFTLAEYLPKFSWSAWRWTKFLIDVDLPGQVVLLGHENCRWYRDLRFAGFQGAPDMRQLADLRQAAAECAQRFPKCEVSAYFGRRAGHGVTFERTF